MAKDTQDNGIVFGTWEAPKKENPYTDVVKQLAEAGENASVTVTVDAKEAAGKQLAFQQAANAIGKTARLRQFDTSQSSIIGQTKKGRDIREGKIALTFTLSEKHKQRRGQDDTVADPAGE